MDAGRTSNIRPAASLLVLRDGSRGVEVLLMRRPERGYNDFRSGACVFPGGVLDATDMGAWPWCLGLDDAQASARLGLGEGGLNFFVAALRECFEEVGLLFVCRSDGSPADVAPHEEALRDWRHRLHQGQATMAALCEAFDWRLDLREMAYYSHWLTPVVRPKRFDTRFFVRVAPAGQTAMPDMGEALELMWLTPDEALNPQRGLKLLNVTQKVLHSLAGWTSARSGFEQALALRGVRRIFPRMALGRDGPRFVIDGDEAYDEVARLDPDGRGDARCDLSPGDVVQLSPRLWRVSGASGNAYLVTDTLRTEAALIDADPADAAQWQALGALAFTPVRWLIFTQAGDARATVSRAQWPAARLASETEGGLRIRLGADCTLRTIAASTGPMICTVEEDHLAVIGAANAGSADLPDGIEWLVPRQGFMRRIASG